MPARAAHRPALQSGGPGVFAVDALECDRCGGRMRILCAVNPPEAIRKILACLGMPIRAPPTAPARIEWGDAADDIPVYSDAYA